MIDSAMPIGSVGTRTVDRLFGGWLECLSCSTRRLADIRSSDIPVLRREGSLNLYCPHCSAWNLHRLVRIGA